MWVNKKEALFCEFFNEFSENKVVDQCMNPSITASFSASRIRSMANSRAYERDFSCSYSYSEAILVSAWWSLNYSS